MQHVETRKRFLLTANVAQRRGGLARYVHLYSLDWHGGGLVEEFWAVEQASFQVLCNRIPRLIGDGRKRCEPEGANGLKKVSSQGTPGRDVSCILYCPVPCVGGMFLERWMAGLALQ